MMIPAPSLILIPLLFIVFASVLFPLDSQRLNASLVPSRFPLQPALLGAAGTRVTRRGAHSCPCVDRPIMDFVSAITVSYSYVLPNEYLTIMLPYRGTVHRGGDGPLP